VSDPIILQTPLFSIILLTSLDQLCSRYERLLNQLRSNLDPSNRITHSIRDTSPVYINPSMTLWGAIKSPTNNGSALVRIQITMHRAQIVFRLSTSEAPKIDPSSPAIKSRGYRVRSFIIRSEHGPPAATRIRKRPVPRHLAW
jgi:hypothetical protein